MNAEDLMQRTIFSVGLEANLEEAARSMLVHRVNALPVLDEQGAVVGVVGIKDVLRAPAPSARDASLTRYQRLDDRARVLRSTRVQSVMARPPITVPPDAPAEDVAATMVNRGVHPLVVVHDGRPVGVIGRADVVRVLLELVDEPAATTR